MNHILTKRVVKISMVAILLWIMYVSGFVFSKPMHTTTDEVGTIVGAARLAGLNWNEIVSTECGYYGFGWYAVFFWLFFLTDSPFVIYRSVIIIAALFRVLIFPIAVEMARKYCDGCSEAKQFVFGIFVVVLSPSGLGMISNEYPLEFLFWLLLYIFCESIYAQERKKIILISTLVFLLAYVMTIHTRAMVIIIAFSLVASLYLLMSGNHKYLPLIAIVSLFGIKLMRTLITFYQNSIWDTEGELRNASPTFFGTFSIDSFRIWISMIIGHITTEMILTGGGFLFALMILFAFIYRNGLFQMFSYKEPLMVIMFVSIICITGVFAAFLLSGWYEGMFITWNTSDKGIAYSYKGLVYVRYWNVFMPPFIFSAFLLNEKNGGALLSKGIPMVVFTIVVLLYMHFVLPLIESHNSAASFLFSIGGYDTNVKITRDYYLYAICISFAVAIVFVCLYSQHLIVALAVVCLFLFFNHTRYIAEYSTSIKNRIATKIDASYELKKRLDTEGIYIDEVYFNDKEISDGNWRIYALGQFYFNRFTAHYYKNNKIHGNDIIISTWSDDSIMENNPEIRRYVLDDNEIWYTYIDVGSVQR